MADPGPEPWSPVLIQSINLRGLFSSCSGQGTCYILQVPSSLLMTLGLILILLPAPWKTRITPPTFVERVLIRIGKKGVGASRSCRNKHNIPSEAQKEAAVKSDNGSVLRIVNSWACLQHFRLPEQLRAQLLPSPSSKLENWTLKYHAMDIGCLGRFLMHFCAWRR